jgi:hypothetical protein
MNLSISEKELKYGFKQGQKIYIDGCLGNIDSYGLIEYSDEFKGFSYIDTCEFSGKIFEWPDSQMYCIKEIKK